MSAIDGIGCDDPLGAKQRTSGTHVSQGNVAECLLRISPKSHITSNSPTPRTSFRKMGLRQRVTNRVAAPDVVDVVSWRRVVGDGTGPGVLL
jgi:hypothetical protein